MVIGKWRWIRRTRKRQPLVLEKGCGSFRVMPFGLCNALATFERLMDYVLAGLPWSVCLVYLDDIIVHGRTFEVKLQNLQKVFDCLRTAKTEVIYWEVQSFSPESGRILGHVVGEEGIATDPAKTSIVKYWPQPTCLTELRSFLGLCSYYRRFICDFSNIASPLTRLLQKNEVFVWDSGAQDSFVKFKEALTNTPVLSFLTEDGTLILDTDASGVAIGAVLSQKQNGDERVIAYFSRSLDRTQRQYCVTRRELLAIIKALSHFHPYLYGRQFCNTY